MSLQASSSNLGKSDNIDRRSWKLESTLDGENFFAKLVTTNLVPFEIFQEGTGPRSEEETHSCLTTLITTSCLNISSLSAISTTASFASLRSESETVVLTKKFHLRITSFQPYTTLPGYHRKIRKYRLNKGQRI